MKALDWIGWVAFCTALVAVPFFVVNWLIYVVRKSRARRLAAAITPKLPLKSVLFFAVPVLSALCVGAVSKSIGRNEIIQTLDSLSSAARVSIDGKAADKPGDILSVLKKTRWIYPHHSHPTKRINVEIADESQSLLLSLGRDSDDPREYWVFYPKYWITSGNEVGRIVTPVFDGY